MIYYIVVSQIAVVVLCAAEAWLEDIVIKLKHPLIQNYTNLNRKEHQRSAVYYFALIGCLLALTWEQIDHHIWLVVVFMFIRRLVFTYGLKVLRHKRIGLIEGDQFTDRIVRNIFGKNGGYRELLFLIAGLITINAVFLL